MKRILWFPLWAGLVFVSLLSGGCETGGGDDSVAVTGVVLNEEAVTLSIGETFQLAAVVSPEDATNSSVVWSSGNTGTATVSDTGIVTAESAGSAVITVTTEDGGQTDLCNITVLSAFAVAFDTSGGSVPETQSVEEGHFAIQPADPIREGYTFAGWFTDNTFETAWDFPGNAITGSTIIFARWDLVIYTIIYHTNGGTLVSVPYTFSIESDDFVLSVPNRVDYSFAGWYENSGLSGNPILAIPAGSVGNREVYAKWVTPHTLFFNNNGGTGVMASRIVGQGLSITLPANSFENTGVGFAGWSTDPDADEPQYLDEAPFTMGSANVTLYAVWKTWYTYTLSGTEATITGFSQHWDGTTEITIPATVDGYSVKSVSFRGNTDITGVTIPDSVTGLESYAFNNCSALNSVTIGSGITTISYGAFQNCRNLETVSLGANVSLIATAAFHSCDQLTEINFPNSLRTIGDSAFRYCSKLPALTLNPGLVYIGESAFCYCSQLTTVIIPSTVTTIGNSAFLDCYRLTTLSVAAGNSVFASDSGILYNAAKTWLIQCPGGKTGSVTVPGTVISILRAAFYNCDGVTSVSLPLSLTTLAEYAFSECDNLSFLTLPSGLTTIGQYAFAGCDKLASITIPASVTAIGKYVVTNSRLLTAINVDAGNTAFSSVGGVLYDKAGKTLLAYPCKKGETFSVPSGVTAIADGAFWESAVTTVTLPEGLLTIGGDAFNSTSLAAITIPSTVTSIGYCAFWNNYSLASITVLAATPPALTSGHIFTYPNRKVYVPAAALAAYQAHSYWGSLTDGATLNVMP